MTPTIEHAEGSWRKSPLLSFMMDNIGLELGILVGFDRAGFYAARPNFLKAKERYAQQNTMAVKLPISEAKNVVLVSIATLLSESMRAVCWVQVRQAQLEAMDLQVLDSRLLAALSGNTSQSLVVQISTTTRHLYQHYGTAQRARLALCSVD